MRLNHTVILRNKYCKLTYMPLWAQLYFRFFLFFLARFGLHVGFRVRAGFEPELVSPFTTLLWARLLH